MRRTTRTRGTTCQHCGTEAKVTIRCREYWHGASTRWDTYPADGSLKPCECGRTGSWEVYEAVAKEVEASLS